MADIQNNEPVAYFYELNGVGQELVLDCNGEYARRLLEAGYTETPLYARAAPPAMDREAVEKDVAFLREAARYFANRPTDGEDRAHWSNVANSESCERIANRLSTLSADAIRQGEGWQLVPTVMTPEMIEAWRSTPGLDCQAAYTAMLAATPASHASDGGKA